MEREHIGWVYRQSDYAAWSGTNSQTTCTIGCSTPGDSPTRLMSDGTDVYATTPGAVYPVGPGRSSDTVRLTMSVETAHQISTPAKDPLWDERLAVCTGCNKRHPHATPTADVWVEGAPGGWCRVTPAMRLSVRCDGVRVVRHGRSMFSSEHDAGEFLLINWDNTQTLEKRGLAAPRPTGPVLQHR